MPPEVTDLLKENLRLTRENNRLLKKLHSAQVWGFWFRIGSFLVIIGVPLFLYRYYFSGYVQGIFDMYRTAEEQVQHIKSATTGNPAVSSLLQKTETMR